MKLKTSILVIAGALAAVNVATAAAPDILGTWQGVHENTDPANSAFGIVSPMVFVVESEVGTAVTGDFDWLSGQSAGCPRDPCTTSWSGTISASGELSIMGQFGDDYVASLVGNSLSGTFTGPNGGATRGYGTWDVTKAPEISAASSAGALTLLLGGLLVIGGRRRSIRTAGAPA